MLKHGEDSDGNIGNNHAGEGENGHPLLPTGAGAKDGKQDGECGGSQIEPQ
jgi:hypothetical protein